MERFRSRRLDYQLVYEAQHTHTHTLFVMFIYFLRRTAVLVIDRCDDVLPSLARCGRQAKLYVHYRGTSS